MKRGDWMVLVLATLFIGMSYAHFWTGPTPATEALVQTGDGHRHHLHLGRDATLHVPGPLGDTRIEVHDGRARIADSPCNDKFCVHYGWLDHGGETIACLPNRVVLQLAGADQDYDAINF
jgi:hypothetical protein